LPLAIQRPLRGPAGEAVVVLLSPSGALFEGDRLRLEVTCDPCVDVTLTTVGATRANRCDSGFIDVQTYVRIGGHATFRYLPHELIPFRGTDYRQSIHVEVEPEARLWLLDIVAPGGSEAPFSYTRLDFETEVRTSTSVILRERFVLSPRTRAQLGTYTHYGSMLLFGAEYDRGNAAHLNQQLADTAAGASTLPKGGIGLKMLGHSAQSVRETLLESAGCPGWLRSIVGV
jgi:urease accessory protein